MDVYKTEKRCALPRRHARPPRALGWEDGSVQIKVLMTVGGDESIRTPSEVHVVEIWAESSRTRQSMGPARSGCVHSAARSNAPSEW